MGGHEDRIEPRERVQVSGPRRGRPCRARSRASDHNPRAIRARRRVARLVHSPSTHLRIGLSVPYRPDHGHARDRLRDARRDRRARASARRSCRRPLSLLTPHRSGRSPDRSASHGSCLATKLGGADTTRSDPATALPRVRVVCRARRCNARDYLCPCDQRRSLRWRRAILGVGARVESPDQSRWGGARGRAPRGRVEVHQPRGPARVRRHRPSRSRPPRPTERTHHRSHGSARMGARARLRERPSRRASGGRHLPRLCRTRSLCNRLRPGRSARGHGPVRVARRTRSGSRPPSSRSSGTSSVCGTRVAQSRTDPPRSQFIRSGGRIHRRPQPFRSMLGSWFSLRPEPDASYPWG
jgi:hypothetical protein